jgi:hypothetical protein
MMIPCISRDVKFILLVENEKLVADFANIVHWNSIAVGSFLLHNFIDCYVVTVYFPVA